MRKLVDNGALFRTIVLVVLAALASLIVAAMDRDVYCKEEVDYRIENLGTKIDALHEDVRWIMRHMGDGHVPAPENNHSP